jgi:hypothetical protein
MSTSPRIEPGFPRVPEERGTYRAWYIEFDTARAIKRPVEEVSRFREWYAHFDAGKWDREFEDDVAAGRLDWLVDEARKDLEEGRCTDR